MAARSRRCCPTTGARLCGRPDQHPYELFLQLEDIAHRTTRVKRPQSNGIVERFHRTVLDEHFRVEGRRTWFETIEEMQIALNAWLVTYNTARPPQGRGMNGRTRSGPSPTACRNPTQKESRRQNQPDLLHCKPAPPDRRSPRGDVRRIPSLYSHHEISFHVPTLPLR